MANPQNLKEAMQILATEVKAKLDTKAESTNVYTKTEADEAFQAAGDYVTNEALGETLQGYAEINPLSPFITEAGAELLYQPKGDYAPAAAENETYAYESYVDTAVATKTDKEVNGSNGKALIFNEESGGGAKFENNDGITNSFAGVNDGGAGIYAQLYAVEKQAGKSRGAKFDVTLGGIYYTTGDDSEKAPTDRDVAANEIATKGDITAAIGTLPTEDEIKSWIADAINNAGN